MNKNIIYYNNKDKYVIYKNELLILLTSSYSPIT